MAPLPPDLTAAFAAFVARTCPPAAELLASGVAGQRPRGLQHLALWDAREQSWLFPTEVTAPRLHEINARELSSPEAKTWAFVLARELIEADVTSIELAHASDDDRACAVYCTEPYGWRATPFVRYVGSVGHSEHPTLFGACYMAFRMGYSRLAPGAVDQLFK